MPANHGARKVWTIANRKMAEATRRKGSAAAAALSSCQRLGDEAMSS
jgi:hypothetical protein